MQTLRNPSLLVLSVLATSLVVSPPVFAAQKATVKPKRQVAATVFYQKNWILGEMRIAVSDSAISIKPNNSSATTISTAPFDVITVFDDSKKTFYKASGAKSGNFFAQRYMKLFSTAPLPKKWKKVESSKIAGLNAGKYVADVDWKNFDRNKLTSADSVPYDLQRNGIWVAEDLKLPAGAADVVMRINGFPELHKFPLEFHQGKKDHARRTRVFTYRVEKKLVDAREFEIPSGYKEIASEYAVQGDDLDIFGGNADLKR